MVNDRLFSHLAWETTCRREAALGAGAMLATGTLQGGGVALIRATLRYS
jgi:hypothetical protein